MIKVLESDKFGYIVCGLTLLYILIHVLVTMNRNMLLTSSPRYVYNSSVQIFKTAEGLTLPAQETIFIDPGFSYQDAVAVGNTLIN